jgi:DUF4097 and DUF4098 domain-containing protein YvlB
MKLNRWIVLVCGLLLVPTALADRQEVDETKAAELDGKVRIVVPRGEVDIQTWDRSEVRVSGLLDEQVERFTFDVRGDETRVEVKVPRNRRWFDGRGSDLEVRVPMNSDLEISGVSTRVDVDGAHGMVEVGAVSGDINVKGGLRRVSLTTVSGEIELRDAEARIVARSVSGDIESYNSTGDSTYGTVSGNVLVEDGGNELTLESVSGDLEVNGTTFRQLVSQSVSGNVDVIGTLLDGGTVESTSVSGSIRLRLGDAVAAKFDIETASGDIRNRISEDRPRVGKYVRDQQLRFSTGDGEGRVTVSTRSGDVVVAH